MADNERFKELRNIFNDNPERLSSDEKKEFLRLLASRKDMDTYIRENASAITNLIDMEALGKELSDNSANLLKNQGLSETKMNSMAASGSAAVINKDIDFGLKKAERALEKTNYERDYLDRYINALRGDEDSEKTDMLLRDAEHGRTTWVGRWFRKKSRQEHEIRKLIKKRRKTAKLERAFYKSVATAKEDNETSWAWGNIGKKVGLKWKRFENKITLKSPQRLAKRLAKRGTLNEIQPLKDMLNEELQTLKTNLQNKDKIGLTPREQKGIKRQISRYEKMIARFDKREKKLNKKLTTLEARRKKFENTPEVRKAAEKIQKRALELHNIAIQRLKSRPEYELAVKMGQTEIINQLEDAACANVTTSKLFEYINQEGKISPELAENLKKTLGISNNNPRNRLLEELRPRSPEIIHIDNVANNTFNDYSENKTPEDEEVIIGAEDEEVNVGAEDEEFIIGAEDEKIEAEDKEVNVGAEDEKIEAEDKEVNVGAEDKKIEAEDEEVIIGAEDKKIEAEDEDVLSQSTSSRKISDLFDKFEMDTPYTHDKGSTMFTRTQPENGEKTRFDLVFKDKNGENRVPDKDELKAVLEQMSKAGVKKMNLLAAEDGGLPLETQAALLQIVKNNPDLKIGIANISDVEQRTENVEKDEHGWPKSKEKQGVNNQNTEEGNGNSSPSPENPVDRSRSTTQNEGQISENEYTQALGISQRDYSSVGDFREAMKKIKDPELRKDCMALYAFNQVLTNPSISEQDKKAVKFHRNIVLSSIIERKLTPNKKRNTAHQKAKEMYKVYGKQSER